MAESVASGPVLSGLVSPQAAELYSRLLAKGGLPIGSAPGHIDIESAATKELLAAGIAFRTGPDDALVRPISPAPALRALLKSRHEELDELQRRIRDGWKRLESLLPTTVGGESAASARGQIELLTDAARIATLAAELFHSPRSQFRGTETGDFPTRPTSNRIFKPPHQAVSSGIQYRYVYQASYHNTPWGRRIIEESAAAGEQVRLRRTMPVKMMHVDDTVALLAIDRAGQLSLLIRSPDLLAMLAEWFDLMWDDPLTTAIGSSAPPGLRPEQVQVLRLLPTAESDMAIARSLNTSVTTVRRHVRAIYTALGVNSRFAAGAAAARRGWI